MSITPFLSRLMFNSFRYRRNYENTQTTFSRIKREYSLVLIFFLRIVNKHDFNRKSINPCLFYDMYLRSVDSSLSEIFPRTTDDTYFEKGRRHVDLLIRGWFSFRAGTILISFTFLVECIYTDWCPLVWTACWHSASQHPSMESRRGTRGGDIYIKIKHLTGGVILFLYMCVYTFTRCLVLIFAL